MKLLISIILITNIGYAQSLESILHLVVENNLALKVLHSEYEAELTKANQINKLPNLELGLGVPVLKPETRLGAQMLMVSASQMFPWFGTLKAKEDVVLSMTSERFERIAILKLDLFSATKKAYYKLQFLNEKEAVLNDFIEVYEALENVSLGKVESGMSTTVDVLRIQLKIQELKQGLAFIDNERKIDYAKINQLINQPIENALKVNTKLDSLIFNFDIARFRTKIKNNHPLISVVNIQVESSKKRARLNKQLNSPTVGFGLDYSLVNNRFDANPIDNGRDILIPKIKISIPVYRKSYKAKVQEEFRRQEALELKKEDLENKMVSLLMQLKANYDNAVLNQALNQKQIRTAQMAYEVLLSSYSSTGNGFDDLLQIQNQLLGYRLAIEKENLNKLTIQAEIERVVGL